MTEQQNIVDGEVEDTEMQDIVSSSIDTQSAPIVTTSNTMISDDDSSSSSDEEQVKNNKKRNKKGNKKGNKHEMQHNIDYTKFINDTLQMLNSSDVVRMTQGVDAFINQLRKEASNANSLLFARYKENTGLQSTPYYSDSSRVFCARDHIQAYGPLERNGAIIQYILQSPQLYEIRKVFETFNKMFAEKDFATGHLLKHKFFLINDLLFKHTLDLDLKTNWPHEDQYKNDYALVKQAMESYANFIVQDCRYAYQIIIQKILGNEAGVRANVLSTMSILARNYQKQHDVLDMYKDKYAELRDAASAKELSLFLLSLISNGDARIIHHLSSNNSHDWPSFIVLDSVTPEHRIFLWGTLNILQRSIVRNEQISTHAKRFFISRHMTNMINCMDSIVFTDPVGIQCSQLMNTIISDLLLSNNYAIVSNNPDLFTYVREANLEDQNMCRFLSKFNYTVPSHIGFVKKVLETRPQFILPFFKILTPFDFSDSLEGLQRCNYVNALGKLPLPQLIDTDILNFEKSTPIIADAVLVNNVFNVKPNVICSFESMVTLVSVLNTLFERIGIVFSDLRNYKKNNHSMDDTVMRQFETSLIFHLRSRFPVSFISFYEQFFISVANAEFKFKDVSDFLLGRCMKLLRFYMRYFVTDDMPRTILNLLQTITPNAAILYQYISFLSDLNVDFNDLIEKDLLVKVIQSIPLDGSLRRSFSQSMISPMLMNSKLFASIREVNTWIRMISTSNTSFTERVLRECFSNNSTLNTVLSDSLQTNESQPIFSEALMTALSRSLEFDSDKDADSLLFVFRVLASILVNSEHIQNNKEMVIDCFQTIVQSKSLKDKNKEVFNRALRLLRQNEEYGSELENLVKLTFSSTESCDMKKQKTFEPIVISLLYSNMHVPLLREFQVQKFLTQKLDRTTTQVMDALFSASPFDLLFFQWNRSILDAKTKECLEPLQNYVMKSLNNLESQDELVAALMQVGNSFADSKRDEAQSFHTRLIAEILQALYTKATSEDFIDILKQVFLESPNSILNCYKVQNLTAISSILQLWTRVLRISMQHEDRISVLKEIWAVFYEQLITDLPLVLVTKQKVLLVQIITSLIDLMQYLPFAHSQKILRLLFSNLSDQVIEVLNSKAVGDSRSVLATLILSDEELVRCIASSVKQENRPLLPLFHSILLDRDSKILSFTPFSFDEIDPRESSLRTQIDPFIYFDTDFYAGLLVDSTLSQTHLDVCILLLCKSSAYEEVTLAHLHKSIKKERSSLSHELLYLLYAYSQTGVKHHNSTIFNDVFTKEIVEKCDLPQRLCATITNKNVSQEDIFLALYVLDALVTCPSIRFSDASLSAIFNVLSMSDIGKKDVYDALHAAAEEMKNVKVSKLQVLLIDAITKVETVDSRVQTYLKIVGLMKLISSISSSLKDRAYSEGVHFAANTASRLLSSHIVKEYLRSPKKSMEVVSVLSILCQVVVSSDAVNQFSMVALVIQIIKTGVFAEGQIKSLLLVLVKGNSEFRKALFNNNHNATHISKTLEVQNDTISCSSILDKASLRTSEAVQLNRLLASFDKEIASHFTTRIQLLTLFIHLLRSVSGSMRNEVLSIDPKLIKEFMILYSARMSEEDLIIHDIFTAYELSGVSKLYEHFYAFGEAQKQLRREIYESQGWNNFVLDENFMLSVHEFPKKIKLFSNYELVLKQMANSPSTDISKIYDPRFILRWILFMTVAFNSDNVDPVLFTSSALPFAVRAIGAKDHSIRQLAYEVLARFVMIMKKQLRNAKSAYKKTPTEYSLLLAFLYQLKASITSPYKPIPNLMALFLSKIANTLRKPTDPAYAECVRFFTRSKFMKLDVFPSFHRTLFTSMQTTGYDWVMEFLLYGLADMKDAAQYVNQRASDKPVLQEILLLFNSASQSAQTNEKVNTFILDFLSRLAKVDRARICVSNGVLSWCRMRLLEKKYSDSVVDKLLDIMIKIVESHATSFTIGFETDALAHEIRSVIDVGSEYITRPASPKLINLSLKFVHRYLKDSHNKELLNRQYLHTTDLLTLLDTVQNQIPRLEGVFEIVALSTFTVPLLTSTESTRLVASRILHTQADVENIASLVRKCLTSIHFVLDQDNKNASLSEKSLEQVTWWLAALFHCVSTVHDVSMKSQFFDALCSPTSSGRSILQLLLDCYLRKPFSTSGILQNLNFATALLLNHVCKCSSSIDYSTLSSTLSVVPVSDKQLCLNAFRSRVMDTPSNTNNYKEELTIYLAQAHNYVSVFLRSAFTISSSSGSEDLLHISTWLKDKIDDIAVPDATTNDNIMQDEEELYDESVFLPTRKETSLSDSESDDDSDSSDSENEDDEQGENKQQLTDSSSDSESSSSDSESSDSDSDDEEDSKPKKKAKK